MGYQITPGIAEEELKDWLNKAAKKYGRFEDGRVNYTDALSAPIIMCTVKCGDLLLLVKRGYGLADAEGYWSAVTGFIDENISVAEITQKELKEELKLSISTNEIKVGASYTLKNEEGKNSYIVFPCLVELNTKPDIELDEEHTEYAWITRKQLDNYMTLDDLAYGIDQAIDLA